MMRDIILSMRRYPHKDQRQDYQKEWLASVETNRVSHEFYGDTPQQALLGLAEKWDRLGNSKEHQTPR